MARKYFDVMLVPEDGGDLRRYRLPRLPRALIIGAGAALLLLVIGACAAYVRAVHVGGENDLLYSENEALRRELVALGGEIDRLDETVRGHINLANDARLLAGLPPFSAEVALLGVGGVSAGMLDHRAGLSDPVARTVGLYHDRLERLDQQLAFQEGSFVEVNQVISASKEKLDHIPTIDPVVGAHYYSSGFGMRRDPFTGRPTHHNGIDFSAPRGTPFCATADGVVTHAGRQGPLGKVIKIDHRNGFQTIFGHADCIHVKKGQEVRRGDVIGEVGSTGRATGSHLHYEIHKDGRAVNPRSYIL
jgi:murein DD-endopeptidase MepM/ murein hydrolase activator NlpD